MACPALLFDKGLMGVRVKKLVIGRAVGLVAAQTPDLLRIPSQVGLFEGLPLLQLIGMASQANIRVPLDQQREKGGTMARVAAQAAPLLERLVQGL